MATSRPGSASITSDVLRALLRQRDLVPRARLIAQYASELLSGAAVIVYVIENQELPCWIAKAVVGDIQLAQSELELGTGTLGRVEARRQPLLFAGNELAREDYAHLNVRRTVV